MERRDLLYVFSEIYLGEEMGNKNQEEKAAFFNQYSSIHHSFPLYSQAFGLNKSIRLQFPRKVPTEVTQSLIQLAFGSKLYVA